MQPGSSGDPSLPRSGRAPTRQARYWMLTIPAHEFTPYLPDVCSLVRGQLERSESGFLHWQLLVAFKTKQSLAGVRRVFGSFHAEPTRSSAAVDYVWKDETYVNGTRFELGKLPFQRNNPDHWSEIWELAKSGRIEAIDPQVRICHYRTLRAICSDYAQPIGMVRSCHVYWGRSGSGKSRLAWESAGMQAYAKDPLSKFWCGYAGQEAVVCDEFRGGISISHLLRWTDRYPVNVEIKGASVPLSATRMFFTSNIHPRRWYPDLDNETLDALMRRLIITEFE